MLTKMRNMKGKKGFTLIELMVVVVIVIVLALALVPTFREIITKSKFTEGITAIGAINTKLKVYYVEHDQMPGCSTDVVYGVSTVSSYGNTRATTQRFLGGNTNYLHSDINGAGGVWAIQGDFSDIQSALAIGQDEYAGAFFNNQDYMVRIDNGGVRTNTYQYTIGVTGSGNNRSPGIGTGYAVCMLKHNFTGANSPLSVATFERYTSLSGCTKQMVLKGVYATTGAKTAYANVIIVPNLAILQEGGACLTYATMTPEFENNGWVIDK